MTTTSISFGSVADVLLSTISTSFENHMPSTSMLEPVSTAFPNSTLNQTAPDSTGSNGNPTATQVVLMAAFIICMIWGNIGNMLVMGAILIDKKLRNTVANIFIFNLAIADFCVTSFVDLSYVLGNIYPQLFKSKSILCNMAASVCIISCTCSMWSICSISINRYICITKSKYYGTIYTRRNTLLMTASLWILCAFIDLPNYIGLGAHIFDVKKMGCSFDRLGHYGYTFYFIGMGVVIPLCLVLFCYIRVFIFVRESERRIVGCEESGCIFTVCECSVTKCGYILEDGWVSLIVLSGAKGVPGCVCCMLVSSTVYGSNSARDAPSGALGPLSHSSSPYDHPSSNRPIVKPPDVSPSAQRYKSTSSRHHQNPTTNLHAPRTVSSPPTTFATSHYTPRIVTTTPSFTHRHHNHRSSATIIMRSTTP
eukprot:XP_011667255.1 PREDICTED: melatonin receptor type 1B-A-like [Strongylocentrotus purpuratus]